MRKLRNHKGPCNVNPIPSVMIFCNCLCQTLYSFLIQNYWTFGSNVGGILLGQYYVMMLAMSNMKQKDLRLSVLTFLGFTGLDIIGGMLAFITFRDNFNVARYCLGIIGLVVLCAVYASPLTAAFDVIKQRDSSTLNIFMTITFTVNSVLWLVYGLFYNDFFIWFPNVIGFVSSMIQFLFYFIFPKKNNNNIEKTIKSPNELSKNEDVNMDISDIPEITINISKPTSQ